MYLYNVTYNIDEDIAQEWSLWMQEHYIPQVMATGLFTQSKLFRLLGAEEQGGLTLAVQYSAATLEHVNRYLSEHAPALTEVMKQKYGHKHVAFMTLLEQLA